VTKETTGNLTNKELAEFEIEWRSHIANANFKKSKELGLQISELLGAVDSATVRATLTYIVAEDVVTAAQNNADKKNGGDMFRELFKFYLGIADFLSFSVDEVTGKNSIKH
jgi:hypothetical protein